MNPFPSLFVSHGPPDLPLRSSPARTFLKQLGNELGQPRAILVISAHWYTSVPTVSAAPSMNTLHDFWGFPTQLYQLQYPAPGAPKLAEQVIQGLRAAGIPVSVHPARGLDHGAWEPLLLMYPQAEIPVAQLAIQPNLGPGHHLKLGQALAPLRQDGVLILASGSATHNLGALGQYEFASPPPSWATAFDRWLSATLKAGDVEQLLNYRHLAPYALQNHPSEEHLLPLFVAVGAAGLGAKGTQLHTSFVYGVLSMAAYAFDAAHCP